MLRITHARTETEQRWTLCGQLRGPWVEEVRACWEQSRRRDGDVHSIVDLSDVTFIDESGENLLWEMRSGGAEFIACGVETKHLLKHLRTGGERSVRRFISPVVRMCQKSKSARKSEADERTEV